MNNVSEKIVWVCMALVLSGCHHYVDEGKINTEEGMDPGVRQIMMDQEHEEPQQEEGLIPAPSEQMYWEQYDH